MLDDENGAREVSERPDLPIRPDQPADEPHFAEIPGLIWRVGLEAGAWAIPLILAAFSGASFGSVGRSFDLDPIRVMTVALGTPLVALLVGAYLFGARLRDRRVLTSKPCAPLLLTLVGDAQPDATRDDESEGRPEPTLRRAMRPTARRRRPECPCWRSDRASWRYLGGRDGRRRGSTRRRPSRLTSDSKP